MLALLAAGGMGALWVRSIRSLPERQTALEERLNEHSKEADHRLDVLETLRTADTTRMVWIICTTIPANTRRELSALRVKCDEVDEVLNGLGRHLQ